MEALKVQSKHLPIIFWKSMPRIASSICTVLHTTLFWTRCRNVVIIHSSKGNTWTLHRFIIKYYLCKIKLAMTAGKNVSNSNQNDQIKMKMTNNVKATMNRYLHLLGTRRAPSHDRKSKLSVRIMLHKTFCSKLVSFFYGKT